MVERYVKLHPALLSMDHATIAKHDIVSFLLDEDESSRAKSLLESLMDLNDVTKALQDSTLTTVGARRAFDWVGRQYPSMKARLSPDAAIVNYPALESGIAKIISGTRLSACEQEACKMFKKPVADPAPETNSRSFLAPVLKKAVKGATSYMPLAWVPPKSNEDAWDVGTIQAVKRKMRN
ncbi:hypothetical protein PPTG_16463 [Phytophthora nicotianae INRA-310]|uniref:Uncharacterized protein n=1 Tax=Phytophthora nicotianae (strain INRA-310) TaxID=761204 RepID=W2PR87_PHYN3|nr:hypothetical protein PPTG_16463 [Phytophthora nicotianae INRA-310]ETN02510.1 hypothetical protein PPTG_16463 [Phytophthora nicotianae INRA-310]